MRTHLRALFISVFAAAALIAGSATTLAVEVAVLAGDTCNTDGSTDTGANNLDADEQDKQVASDADENGKMHDEQASTDKGNNECGTNEDGAKENKTAGAGTHGDMDHKDNGAATPATGASGGAGTSGNGANGNNNNQDDGQK
ncbi:MAG TPA: hypothetical protein VI056_09270 [Candidatus Limnocylindria bacterium]